MGKIELDHTGSGGGVTLSSDGTDLLLDGTAIGGGGGGGADLYAAETTGSTDPTATGTLSVAIGSNAQSDGNQSVAIGVDAVSGLRGVSIGQQAGNSTASGGDYNVSVGFNSAYYLTTGDNNVAVGRNALQSSNLDKLTGSSNVGVGYLAGSKVTSGSFNTFLGNNAGNSVTTGSNNVSIGYNSDCSASTSSQTAVGYNAQVAGSQATALTYSYASGADSFAAAIANNTSSYGALNTGAIAMGNQNKAAGYESFVAGGYSNTANNYRSSILNGTGNTVNSNYGTILGGESNTINSSSNYSIILCGEQNQASHQYTVASGKRAKAKVKGQMAHSAGHFSATGDAQTSLYVLRLDTDNANAQDLSTDNGAANTSNQITLDNYTAYAFEGTIVAREDATDGTDCAAWKVEGLIRREGNAGTTTLVASTVTAISNTPSWGLALAANTTVGCLKITGTGAASTNIRWVANIRTSEVTYA